MNAGLQAESFNLRVQFPTEVTFRATASDNQIMKVWVGPESDAEWWSVGTLVVAFFLVNPIFGPV